MYNRLVYTAIRTQLRWLGRQLCRANSLLVSLTGNRRLESYGPSTYAMITNSQGAALRYWDVYYVYSSGLGPAGLPVGPPSVPVHQSEPCS